MNPPPERTTPAPETRPANGRPQRGTSKEFLQFSCYKTAEDRKDGTDPLEYAEASDASLGRLWTSGKILADECAANAKKTGEVISSAFTARDIISIVDALGDDDVNFFGMKSFLLLLYWGRGTWANCT